MYPVVAHPSNPMVPQSLRAGRDLCEDALRSVGELENTLRISAVAACCSRASECSLVNSWFLRIAEARSSVGGTVMTTRTSHATSPRGFGPAYGDG